MLLILSGTSNKAWQALSPSQTAASCLLLHTSSTSVSISWLVYSPASQWLWFEIGHTLICTPPPHSCSCHSAASLLSMWQSAVREGGWKASPREFRALGPALSARSAHLSPLPSPTPPAIPKGPGGGTQTLMRWMLKVRAVASVSSETQPSSRLLPGRIEKVSGRKENK